MKINNRLLKILDFLEKNSETTIRKISAHLDISERSVRYEIENLNFLLDLNNLPPVEKEFDNSQKSRHRKENNRGSKNTRSSFQSFSGFSETMVFLDEAAASKLTK